MLIFRSIYAVKLNRNIQSGELWGKVGNTNNWLYWGIYDAIDDELNSHGLYEMPIKFWVYVWVKWLKENTDKKGIRTVKIPPFLSAK